MQRFVNDPDMIVDDMLKGYVKCHKAVSYTHLTLFGYPVIITVITFCMVLFVMNINGGVVVPSLIILVAYFCMIFFSNRKIQIKKLHVIVFALLYIGTFGFSYMYTQTKGLGMVKEFPSLTDMVRVNIDVNASSIENDSAMQFYDCLLYTS